MASVDEIHEIGGRAEAAGHRVVADSLIAPRRVERMFHDRQQFDMRVAHLFHVRHKFVRQFPVSEPAIALVRFLAPGTGVYLVDRHRRMEPVTGGAAFDPAGIIPVVAVDVDDDRCGIWAEFAPEAVGIRFEAQIIPNMRKDLEFVESPSSSPGMKSSQMPEEPRFRIGRMAPVPKIEISDDAHSFRVGSPNRKFNALDARNYAHVRAQLFIVQVIRAFAQQIEVVVASARAGRHKGRAYRERCHRQIGGAIGRRPDRLAARHGSAATRGED